MTRDPGRLRVTVTGTGDGDDVLALGQLGGRRALRHFGWLIALVVRVLRTALSEQVGAFSRHVGAGWG